MFTYRFGINLQKGRSWGCNFYEKIWSKHSKLRCFPESMVHVGKYIPVPWSLLGNGIKSVNLLRIRYQLPPDEWGHWCVICSLTNVLINSKRVNYFERTCWRIGHARIHTQANKGPFLQHGSMCFSREKQNAFQTLHAPCFVNYLSTFWIWFQRPRHFIENTVIAVFITVAIGVTVGHAVGVTTVGYCGDKLCSWERIDGTDGLTKRNVTVES